MAAIDWLTKAFGFEISLLVTDDHGKLVHSELSFGDGYIMVAGEFAEGMKSPKSIGGANTQAIHVQLTSDIDAHCERARAAGATILAGPEDQFYGDRTYRARDPEGHFWSFGQTVRVVSNEEMAAASGLRVSTS
jgi:uncharacterized glyoxalase superfamily protein PhnB